MSTTSILGITEIGESQNNKYITINNAIVALEQAANRGLANASVGAGPWALTEAEATRYAVFRASGGSAAFNITMPSQINTINATRVFAVINEDTTYTATVKASTGAGATVDLLPGESGTFYQSYEDVYLISKGQAGSSPPYDVGLYIPGKPGDGAEVFKFVAVRPVEWPDDWAGSYGHIGVNPTDGANVFTIKKNGSSIGSISISTGGVFTFATTGTTTTLAAGDRLTIENQATADSTAADIGFNLAGARV